MVRKFPAIFPSFFRPSSHLSHPSCLEVVVSISKPLQRFAVLGGWQLRWFGAGQPLCLCGLWGDRGLPRPHRRSTQDLPTEERPDHALPTEEDSANAHPAGESRKLGPLCGSLTCLDTKRERNRLYQVYVWRLVQFRVCTSKNIKDI